MERPNQLRWSSIKKPSVMILAFMLCHVSPAYPELPGERATLAGLTGVEVVVETMKPDAEREGLAGSTIQTDVELKLRQAGIRVLTSSDGFLAPGNPYLYLNVNTSRTRTGIYAYCIELQVKQGVKLTRNPAIISSSPTWQARGYVGTVGASNLHTVRDDVRDMVDQFVNAYLAANPKR
jgi:hypothetical protein